MQVQNHEKMKAGGCISKPGSCNLMFHTIIWLNVMIVSFYWVLCCIPVVTVLPASAALYHCVTRVVMASGSGVCRDFFRSFKSALKPGAALTVIVEIVGTPVYIGIRTGMQNKERQPVCHGVYGSWGAGWRPLRHHSDLPTPGALPVRGGDQHWFAAAHVFIRQKGAPFHLVRSAAGHWDLICGFLPPALFVIPALYTDLIRGGVEKSMILLSAIPLRQHPIMGQGDLARVFAPRK